MRLSATKFISLLFFVLSAFYLYQAHQIVVFTFDENAPFNARTFPIYLGWAGMFFSGLKIILPEKKREVRIKKLAQVYYISQNELFKDLEEELKYEEKINR